MNEKESHDLMRILSSLACGIFVKTSAVDILKQRLKKYDKKLYRSLFQNKDTKISEDQKRKMESEYLAFILFIIRKGCLIRGISNRVIGIIRLDVCTKLMELGIIQRVIYYENQEEIMDKTLELMKMFDDRFNVYSEASIIHGDGYNTMVQFSRIVAKNIFGDILYKQRNVFLKLSIESIIGFMLSVDGKLVTDTIDKAC